MTRPLRLEYDGAFFHITARGNNRQPIFRDDEECDYFIELLGEATMRFNWIVIAWVLMVNHYHLAVQTPQETLSRGMHWLNQRYAQWFNRRANRVGHLFQGRFDARLIDKEAYFLEVCRYIVLNPVRAGMVKHPQDWKSSSYPATAGLTPQPKWLAINEILRAFGPTVEDARLEYASFVARGIESPGKRLEGGRPLWLEDTQKLIDSKDRSIEHPSREIHVGRPDMTSVFQAVARTFHVQESDCRKGRGGFVRSVAAYLAFHDGTLRLTDIAEALNLTNPSSVSRLVARCEAAIANSDALREMVARCRTRFTRGQVLIFAFGDGGKAKIKT